MVVLDAPIGSVDARATHRDWSTLSLQRRILLACVPPAVCGLLVIGAGVSAKIVPAIKIDSGYRAAKVLEGIVVPNAQDPADGALSDASMAAVRHDVARIGGPLRVVETKVWGLDGRIIFAGGPDGLGQRFPVEGLLASAIAGRPSMAVKVADDAAGTADHPAPVGIRFGTYVPFRLPVSGKAIAVAEVHRETAIPHRAMAVAPRQTWAVVGIVGLALIAALYHVRQHGQRIIDRQRADLRRHEAERAALQTANEALREQARHSAAQAAESSEALLRRVGADIHDGIGQLIIVAMLKLDQFFGDTPRDPGHQAVRTILDEAMTEAREMSAGLSLPRISELPIAEAVGMMVHRHERRTSTQVLLTIARDLAEPGTAVKLAICRFVQEGLSNAFRHAQARGQSVEIGWAGPMIAVTVSDAGPGLPGPDAPGPQPALRPSLGLAGLKTRVEALGGEFAMSSRQADCPGTTLRATFPVVGERSCHA